MQINYYKTKNEFLSKTVCQLAEKSSAEFEQTHIITNSDEMMDSLDVVLWTYSRKNFLPHSRISDPLPERQPILISTINSCRSNISGNIILVNIEIKDLPLIFGNLKKKKKPEKLSIINEETIEVSKNILSEIIIKADLNTNGCSFFKQSSNAAWASEK